MRIKVEPGKGRNTPLEDGSWLNEENCPEGGKTVNLTPGVRRLIAAGDLVNVTPEGGVPDEEPGPDEPETAAATIATTVSTTPAAASRVAPVAPATGTTSVAGGGSTTTATASAPAASTTSGATVSGAS